MRSSLSQAPEAALRKQVEAQAKRDRKAAKRLKAAHGKATLRPQYDHHRVSPEGRYFGLQLAKHVEPVIKYLESQGEPDERCKSCAFRAGTVPNGCMQTMADAHKAMLEQKPFLCHVEKYADGKPKQCAGWLASMWGAADREPIPCSWEFSPPDEEGAQSDGN